MVNEGGKWHVRWQAPVEPNVPPQVVPVNYLRWDIIRRGSEDDWGAQNVEAPRVRIVSMNAIEHDDTVIILGEVVNEDTVPGFVTSPVSHFTAGLAGLLLVTSAFYGSRLKIVVLLVVAAALVAGHWLNFAW